MRFALMLAALLLSAGQTSAQELTSRIQSVRDGLVRFSYASRPDVCGDGRVMIGWNNTQMQFYGNWSNYDDASDVWERCEHGPLHVTITRSEGRSINLRVMAGPVPPDSIAVTDIGTFPVAMAVKTLLGIARSEDTRAADRAILAAALADSAVVWPELLTFARDPNRSKKVRQEARQWLAWLASDHVVGPAPRGRGKKQRDSEKTQAVFVLAELPHGEGIPDLLRIGRSHPDADVRRSALFWLGQSGDPRALDLFEELLRSP